MTKLTNPIPLWYDATGLLMDGGYIYVGVANADPQVQPVDLFWDAALTVPAMQPLRTMGGRIVNGASPANVFFAAQDFSILTLNAQREQVDYQPTTYLSATTYQPLDPSLTTISEQGLTPYGVALLELPDQNALRQAAGSATAVQKTGDTMTGNLNRQGAGAFAYGGDAGSSPRIFLPKAMGAANPANLQPGDLWGFY